MKIKSATAARLAFWCAVIGFGFLQAWASRMDIGMDTISYLDIGDYVFAGHWSMALNGVWNPLYPLILGLTLHTLHPSPSWQYPVVHLLLFVIFIFAAACFDFLLQQLLLFHEEQNPNARSIAAWTYPAIGYLLFLWSSLGLIRVSETSPDMLLAAFLYLATGCLVLIRRGSRNYWVYALFGLALGCGYLTKSAMFPIALLYLLVAGIFHLQFGKGRSHQFLAAAIVFLFVSMLFIAPLSLAKGKITFGESSTYNYLVHVDGVPASHWQGDPKTGEYLPHPTVMIFEHPATFEFPGLPGGSYPVWYDPSYWYEGAKTRVDMRDTMAALSANCDYLALRLIVAFNGALVPSLFLLLCMADSRLLLGNAVKYWYILVPSLASIGMYLIVHTEARYVAPLLTIAVLSLLLSIPVLPGSGTGRALSGTAVLLAVMFVCPIGPGAIPKNLSVLKELLGGARAGPNRFEQVASGLSAMGLRSGDRIASLEYSLCAIRINDTCEGTASWARLGDFHIVAEVNYSPEDPSTRDNDFWEADRTTQQALIRSLSQSGARVLVSRRMPRGPDANAWMRIGQTPYYARSLGSPVDANLTRTPGPLAVCTSNPRYFCDPSGTIVFLAGDHTWADLQDSGANQAPNIGAFDFNSYMAFMNSHGYTWMRMWSFMFSQEPPCCTSWVPQIGPVWPWLRVGPGTANDGLLKTDFTRLDPNYFSRLRSRVIQAGQNGLYVSVMLFSDVGGSESSTDGDPFVSGNNINGVSCAAPCPVTLPLNSTVWSFEQAYIHKVIDTVHDLPNAMYEVINEPPTASASWVAQVMNEIRSYESTTYGSQHPVGINYGNNVSDSYVYNTNADYVSPSTRVPPAATGQCPTPTGNGEATNRSSGRCKVVINDSDHSYYYTVMQSQGMSGQINWVWENFTMGNGVAFMDPYTFPWSKRNECRSAPTNRDQGLCSADGLDSQWDSIRQSISDIVAYAKKIDLRDMTPQPRLFGSHYGLASTSRPMSYLMFSPNGSRVEEITVVRGTYTVELFDTTMHSTVSIKRNVNIGSSYSFIPPGKHSYAVWIH